MDYAVKDLSFTGCAGDNLGFTCCTANNKGFTRCAANNVGFTGCAAINLDPTCFAVVSAPAAVAATSSAFLLTILDGGGNSRVFFPDLLVLCIPRGGLRSFLASVLSAVPASAILYVWDEPSNVYCSLTALGLGRTPDVICDPVCASGGHAHKDDIRLPRKLLPAIISGSALVCPARHAKLAASVTNWA